MDILKSSKNNISDDDLNSWANIDANNSTNINESNAEKAKDDFDFDAEIAETEGATTKNLEHLDFSANSDCTALVTVSERRLLAVQNVFKKSIRVSLKSFLLSLSLSFLNLFI